MSRGGYNGGSSIMYIGGGFTGWTRSLGHQNLGGQLKGCKKSAKNVRPLSGAEVSYIYRLAKAKVDGTVWPPMPHIIRISPNKRSDPAAWLKADNRRNHLFKQHIRTLQKGTAKPRVNPPARKPAGIEKQYIATFLEAIFSGKTIPTPPAPIKQQIQDGSGPYDWIHRDEQRLAFYHKAFKALQARSDLAIVCLG